MACKFRALDIWNAFGFRISRSWFRQRSANPWNFIHSLLFSVFACLWQILSFLLKVLASLMPHVRYLTEISWKFESCFIITSSLKVNLVKFEARLVLICGPDSECSSGRESLGKLEQKILHYLLNCSPLELWVELKWVWGMLQSHRPGSHWLNFQHTSQILQHNRLTPT